MSSHNRLVTLPLAARGEGGTYYLPIAALPSRQQGGGAKRDRTTAPALRPLRGKVQSWSLDDPPLSPGSDRSSLPDMDGENEVDEVEFEYPLPPGRKKRKTPAYQLSSGRQDEVAVYEGDVKDGTHRHQDLPPVLPDGPQSESDSQHPRSRVIQRDPDDSQAIEDNASLTHAPSQFSKSRRWAKPAATQSCEFRKLQFLRRKAALITLFLDATSAIKSYWKDERSATTVNMSKSLLSKLPEVDAFEKLLPALEDVGVSDWPADKPTWRKGTAIGDDGDVEVTEGRRLGVWRAKFAKRRKIREERKEVVRGGWAPEGSFEFENSSKAGNVAREGAKARAALQRLANELRHILLTVKPKTAALADQPVQEGGSPEHKRQTARRSKKADSGALPTQTAEAEAAKSLPDAATTGGEQLERVGSGSKDGSEGGSGSGGKKKPKKKKRSVLANQSNPHHVDNYRPTRTVASAGDPNEPYPHHASLLFPPSMAFLSVRPNANRVRPAEDDYICSFCEYDLFYGSEKLRRAAIRRRKREIKRKENIKNKAKNVAEGKGKLNDESEYDEEGDEDEECEDLGYGKCSCGRALGPHGDKEHHLKPPDPDPNKAVPSTLPTDTAGMPRFQPVVEADLSRASTPSID